MKYLLLLLGFVFLIKGADYFVDGSSKIAKLLRIPPLVIGLTIVSFGTGAPEATVSIIAALEGSAELVLGNVVGSNIINISFIVGITALIFPLKVESATIRKEIPFTFLASITMLALLSDMALNFESVNILTRGDGIVFLLFFSIFMYYVIEIAMNHRDDPLEKTIDVKEKGTWGKSLVITVLGLAGVILGGYLVVETSTEIAYSFGLSETLVGLTIVAIGSSLPELITSIVAAMKKESEIALGNIVGSCIFNILFVLGISSIISPLIVNDKIFFDIFVMLGLTIFLFVFSRTQYEIAKSEGFALSVGYIVYIIYIIIRN